ncbi:MAPK kinase substrate protein At1g80180-like [Durio zibethinus]|uniref:MAPK kinase substrate protein At1g80180-like n=1 Tax=Durio zibethinus TaxID=66656 RepID=A0A6P5WY67_DURZI|nr:MAPK kinase substrate protein At1g80180-like [Durio zibethinus]
MAGLQRSAVSFRRQGSSGFVWDDRFLSELNQVKQEQQEGETKQLQQDEQGQLQDNKPEKNDVIRDVKPTRNVGPINTIERSRSGGERRGYRTGKVSPATEPPSPKVSACGFCIAFGKQAKNHRKTPSKRR